MPPRGPMTALADRVLGVSQAKRVAEGEAVMAAGSATEALTARGADGATAGVVGASEQAARIATTPERRAARRLKLRVRFGMCVGMREGAAHNGRVRYSHGHYVTRNTLPSNGRRASKSGLEASWCF